MRRIASYRKYDGKKDLCPPKNGFKCDLVITDIMGLRQIKRASRSQQSHFRLVPEGGCFVSYNKAFTVSALNCTVICM